MAITQGEGLDYFGYVDASDGIGTAICHQISIEYSGCDHTTKEQAELIREAIAKNMASMGQEIATYEALAVSSKGKEIYSNKTPVNINTEAHEKWHSHVYDAGYAQGDSYTQAGLIMLNEGQAYAMGDYIELSQGHSNETLSKNIEKEKAYSREGSALFSDIMNDMHSGQNVDSYKEEVKSFLHKHWLQDLGEHNWTSFLIQLENFSLYEQCFEVLDSYGLEQGKAIFDKSFEIAKTYKSIRKGAEYLDSALKKGGKTVPLAEHYLPLVKTGKYALATRYVGDIKVTIFSEDKSLKDTIDTVLEETVPDYTRPTKIRRIPIRSGS